MASDEFFPTPDDESIPPQDDQPETSSGDQDAAEWLAPAESPAQTAAEEAPGELGAQSDASEPGLPVPPRIVAEQPVGAPVTPSPRPPLEPTPPHAGEPMSDAAEAAPTPELAEVSPADAAPDAAPVPERAEASPAEAEMEATRTEDIARAIEAMPPVDELDLDAALIGKTPSDIAEAPEPALPAERSAPEPVVPAEPGPIRSRSTLSAAEAEPVERADARDWDDEISPELAAILFAGAAAAGPAPEREDTTAEGEELQRPAAQVTRAPSPASAGPLTDVSDARRLPITAEGTVSPAPEAQPEGKCRYVRVEEPLDREGGQRISETWSYLKPDYPALEGRLVRRVHIEEYRYADGSWKWSFERQYTDRGMDTREVRANRDGTFLEHRDRIAKKDPSTNQRIRVSEKTEMILAGPEIEDKGGLLSRLFGRGDKAASGPAEWRPATSAEARRARVDGGRAVGRKLFGLF